MVVFTATASAQTGSSWLENTMYSSGKINVVVAVVAAVFVMITIYLISLDKKLKKLEQSEKIETK
jgi:CcmD family protein